MPSTPVVLAFKDATGYGWTERYFGNYSVAPGPIPIDIQNLLIARANFLTNTSQITHVRVGTNTKRNPIIFSVNGGAGYQGGEQPPTAPSEVAILIRWECNVLGFGFTFARGIPERVVQADNYVPDAAFAQNIAQYLFLISQTGKYNMQGTLGSPAAHVPASGFNPILPRGFTCNLSPPAPVPQGGRVRFHQVKTPGYNGLKTVTVSPTGASTQYTFGGAAPSGPDAGGAGYATLITPYDNTIVANVVLGLSRRAAGRPFGLRRGRQATLYSLRQ